MIDQYNSVVSLHERFSILKRLLPRSRRFVPLNAIYARWMGLKPMHPLAPDTDDKPRPGGRWYHAGKERTCQMLVDLGYQIIDPDVGTCPRDPIIHFRKS